MSGEFPQVAQKKHVDGETSFLDNDTWVICHFYCVLWSVFVTEHRFNGNFRILQWRYCTI